MAHAPDITKAAKELAATLPAQPAANPNYQHYNNNNSNYQNYNNQNYNNQQAQQTKPVEQQNDDVYHGNLQ